MIRVLTDFLDEAVEKYGEKIAFEDADKSLTYRELKSRAQFFARRLYERNIKNRPVLIFLPSCVECAVFAYATAYSANFYTILNQSVGKESIEEILREFSPQAILTNNEGERYLQDNYEYTAETILYEEYRAYSDNKTDINCAISRDAIFVIFTSGSTGKPKGVVHSHESALKGISDYKNLLMINDKSRLAEPNNNMFAVFSMNMFVTIAGFGSEYIFSQKELFLLKSFYEMVTDKRLNKLMCISFFLEMSLQQECMDAIANCEFETIVFAGAPVSIETINKWRKRLPNTYFMQQYGLTELWVGAFCKIDRDYGKNEKIPIGKPFENAEFIMPDGEEGELYIRASNIALGYYKNPKATKEVFVQNPLHNDYPDIVVRTGDFVRLGDDGNYYFIGRKDSMIKRRGYRIELGEIDKKAEAISGLDEGLSLYDEASERIFFFYAGTVSEKEILHILKDRLRSYMLPDRIVRLDEIPHGNNMKVDRKGLREMMKNL